MEFLCNQTNVTKKTHCFGISKMLSTNHSFFIICGDIKILEVSIIIIIKSKLSESPTILDHICKTLFDKQTYEISTHSLTNGSQRRFFGRLSTPLYFMNN